MSQKACLFNLIVFTENLQQVNYLDEVVKSIVARFPARVILIQSDPSIQQIKIEKKVLGEKLYEEVSVELPCNHLKQIELFVLPFLIPDYPICLFYSGNPASDNPSFEELIRLSSRLIVDSETSDNLKDFCSTILHQIGRKIEVVDLNWARTLGWRLILSNLFDTPEKLKNLAQCKEIRIEFNPSLHSHNPALYFQAWLATCFHWGYCERKETQEITYKNPHPLKVLLIPTERAMRDEVITSVEIVNQDALSYTIFLAKDQQVVVHVCDANTCALPYTLYFPSMQRGGSYLTQLFYSTTSSHYCAMLPTLQKML